MLAPLFYFAYGSNMDPDRVRKRGIVFDQILGGTLRGYGLRFQKKSTVQTGAGHANIVVSNDEFVEGLLFKLSGEDQIEKMDPFERVPTNYSRDTIHVDSKAGRVAAWTYFANPDVMDLNLKPPRWYLDHLLEGRPYLSSSYVRQLEQIDCLD